MKKIRLFFKKITKKYKLVFLSSNSLEERFSLVTSRLYVFYVFLCLFIISVALCFVVLLFTPISNYFITNSDTIDKKEFANLMHYTDSLELVIDRQYQWVDNFRSIVLGDINPPNLDSIKAVDLSPNIVNLDYVISEADSILRSYVEHEENLLNSFVFVKPTSGRVTDSFSVNDGHYGVDVATNYLEKIYSVLDGEVLIVGENAEFGNFLIINHSDNIMSIYMHADNFIKKRGETISAGDLVGFTGNTGTLSTGTHLHFELKHNGINVDPEKYITF